jgi:hypothetical protein
VPRRTMLVPRGMSFGLWIQASTWGLPDRRVGLVRFGAERGLGGLVCQKRGFVIVLVAPGISDLAMEIRSIAPFRFCRPAGVCSRQSPVG